MKKTILILWGLTLFPLFAVPASAADESPLPKRFSAHIGGFLGASYTVELHEDALIYTSPEAGSRVEKRATISPTAAQWREFWLTLDAINAWQWRADYPSSGVNDGTQWSLDIAHAGHSLKTRGNNSYPGVNGKPHAKPVPTEVFHRYLAAVRKLIGGRNFE